MFKIEYLVATSYDKESTCSLDFGSMQPVPNYEIEFQKALTLQQEKKYDKAIAVYQQILDQGLAKEQAADVCHNLSLSYFLKKDYLKSFIYNQKSIHFNPYQAEAKKLTEALKKDFQVKTIPHEISVTEQVHNLGLSYFPVESLWVAALIFLILAGRKTIFFYFGKKRSYLENTPSPVLDFKVFIFLFLFVSLGLLAGLKAWDELTPKAFIAVESVNLMTAAGPNQAVLTDLPGGTLVEILRTAKINSIDYYQIKYSGGVSGWVDKNQLELLYLPKD